MTAHIVGEWDVVNAMIKFGGSFVKALGLLYQRADDENMRRLRQAFPEYWKEYAELARLEIEKAKR